MANEAKKEDYVLVLEPSSDATNSLLESWKEREGVAIQRFTSPQELKAFLQQVGPSMVIASNNDRNSFAMIATLLKLIQDEIKYGLIKTLVLSKEKNPKMAQFITSQGVTDYIEEPVALRTVTFKANLQLRAIETIKKREALKKAAKEKISIKKDEPAKGNEKTTETINAEKKVALALGEDCFLFRHNTPKKWGKKTMLELGGPAPSAGEWNELEPSEDGQNRWVWVPKEEKFNPKNKKPENGWVHTGDKPEFDEKSGQWKMLSEKPDLSHYRAGKKEGSKVSQNKEGKLEIAADSAQAEAAVKKTNPKFFAKEELAGANPLKNKPTNPAAPPKNGSTTIENAGPDLKGAQDKTGQGNDPAPAAFNDKRTPTEEINPKARKEKGSPPKEELAKDSPATKNSVSSAAQESKNKDTAPAADTDEKANAKKGKLKQRKKSDGESINELANALNKISKKKTDDKSAKGNGSDFI
jgi:hypothetical protein